MNNSSELNSKTNHRKSIHDKIISRENDKVYINNKEIVNVIIINNYNNVDEIINIIDEKCEVIEGNIFQDILKKVHTEETSQKQQDFATQYLKKKRDSLNDILIQGSFFYKEKRYEQALNCFETSIKIIFKDSYPDEYGLTLHSIFAIKYAIIMCNYAINTHGSLQTTISQLRNIITDQGLGCTYPYTYFSLAKAHFTLKEFEMCRNVLTHGMKEQAKCIFFEKLFWPGTEIIIEDADLVVLKVKMQLLLKECNNARKPDAVCCYQFCLPMGNIQKAIYFESPRFTGYVLVECSDHCGFAYHRNCWRKFNKMKDTHLDILGSTCYTPGCIGILSTVRIFDETQKLVTTKIPKTSAGRPVVPINNVGQSPVFEQYSPKIEKKENLFDTDPCCVLIEDETMVKVEEIMNDDSCNIELSPEKENQASAKCVIKETNSIGSQTDVVNIQNVHIQCSAEVDQKSAQTIYEEEDELAQLKSYLNTLKISLYQAEDSYNLLLRKKKCPICKKSSKELNCDKREATTQADLKIKSNEKHTALNLEVNQYKMKCLKLEADLNCLNSMLESEQINLCNQKHKYELQIEELMNKITSLEQTNKQLTENAREAKKSEGNIANVLIQQLHYSQYIYNHFLSLYKDKCNRIIWEMKDMHSLVNAMTTPTINEVTMAENNWIQSSILATQFQAYIQDYYDTMLKKITMPKYCLDDLPTRPQPELPTDPPYLCSQYFKVLVHLNIKLEQQIGYQNSLLLKNMQHNQWIPSQQLPAQEFQEPLNETQVSSYEDTDGKDEACAQSVESSNSVAGNNDFQMESLTEFPKAIETSGHEQSFENNTKTEKLTMSGGGKRCKILNEVMMFLKKHYPNIPNEQIDDAVQQLRQRHGKLTGMSVRNIKLEVQQILFKDYMQRTDPQTKEVKSTWAKVENEPLKWNNDQRDGTCSICFEYLDTKIVQLRCQHIYHIYCIRKWLQSNSICPICRVFTTLDEDFPSLK